MPPLTPKDGLNLFFGESEARKFLSHHWPDQPFAVHDQQQSSGGIMGVPFLKSLEAMLSHWPKTVQVHLPDLADEASSIDASPKDAQKLFSNGMPLLFNEVNAISDLLTQELKAIHRDLGLPKMTYSRCMVYAIPSGKGTAWHFDQNINFVVQLTGTKTWWLAQNETVDHPSQRHALGQTVDPELASYVGESLPTRAPEKKTKVVLKPGSVLFVPQGYWHSTEAEGEALSLNFTFSQPSFADLFLAALRSRLLLSPEWRELADGVSSQNPNLKEIATQKFDDLLLELVHDLPHWNATDILNATE